MLEIVKEAARKVGGVSELARLIRTSRQNIGQWPEVPDARAGQIEVVTDGAITAHELRPDLYPEKKL